uniref:Ig-like domain-containing protein n=1 Tax=Mastacembelus armatus TaxID=205130 RepID=A0A7N8Y279_9TELE
WDISPLPQTTKTLELKPESKRYSSVLEKKKEKPVFLSQLSSAAVTTGETARFTVKVSGFPKPTVQWSHNGNVIKSSSVYKLIEEKEEYTLVITRVTSEYEGEYSCTPDVSQAEKWVEKMFKKLEPKVTWKQGVASCLQCTVKGSPELHIHWFLNDRELSEGEKYKISFKNGVATLEIMNLLVTDSGSYTCEVSNNAGSESCNTHIAVKGLPNLELQTVELECKVSGSPPFNISWYHDGEEIQSGPNYEISFSENSCTLRVPTLKLLDSGVYKCKAVNKAGSTETTASLLPTSTTSPQLKAPASCSVSALMTRKLQENTPVKCPTMLEKTHVTQLCPFLVSLSSSG